LTLDVTASLLAQQAGSLPGYGWALLPWPTAGWNGVDLDTSEAAAVLNRPLLTTPCPSPSPGQRPCCCWGWGHWGCAAERRSRAGYVLSTAPGLLKGRRFPPVQRNRPTNNGAIDDDQTRHQGPSWPLVRWPWAAR